MNDRIQFDGTDLDEIVLSNVTFHIEAMSHHGWWIGVTGNEVGPDKRRVDLWFAMTTPLTAQHMEWENLAADTLVQREPVVYDCPTKWIDRHGGEHQCGRGKPKHRKPHKCECDAELPR